MGSSKPNQRLVCLRVRDHWSLVLPQHSLTGGGDWNLNSLSSFSHACGNWWWQGREESEWVGECIVYVCVCVCICKYCEWFVCALLYYWYELALQVKCDKVYSYMLVHCLYLFVLIAGLTQTCSRTQVPIRGFTFISPVKQYQQWWSYCLQDILIWFPQRSSKLRTWPLRALICHPNCRMVSRRSQAFQARMIDSSHQAGWKWRANKGRITTGTREAARQPGGSQRRKVCRAMVSFDTICHDSCTYKWHACAGVWS